MTRFESIAQAMPSLPPHRLRQLCRVDQDGTVRILTLPEPVIRALCFARSVDEEIDALTIDLPSHEAALIRARWRYRSPATWDDLAREFAMTLAAAQRIIRNRTERIRRAGLALPVASTAIHDLEEAGGALSTEDFLLLLKYSEVDVSPAALQVLPELYQLGCTPLVSYRPQIDRWLTRRAIARLAADGQLPQEPTPSPRTRADQLRRSLFGEA